MIRTDSLHQLGLALLTTLVLLTHAGCGDKSTDFEGEPVTVDFDKEFAASDILEECRYGFEVDITTREVTEVEFTDCVILIEVEGATPPGVSVTLTNPDGESEKLLSGSGGPTDISTLAFHAVDLLDSTTSLDGTWKLDVESELGCDKFTEVELLLTGSYTYE